MGRRYTEGTTTPVSASRNETAYEHSRDNIRISYESGRAQVLLLDFSKGDS